MPTNVDQTGLGPASGGFNPTSQELALQIQRLANSVDALSRMQMQTPGIRDTADRISGMPKNLSEAQQREWRQQPGWQAAMVASGWLHESVKAPQYGSVNNTLANYSQLMSQGVQVSVNRGGVTGVDTMVGNGRITSQLATQYAGQINRAILGPSGDPRNAYGANQEDISQIVRMYHNAHGAPLAHLRSANTSEVIEHRIRTASDPDERNRLRETRDLMVREGYTAPEQQRQFLRARAKEYAGKDDKVNAAFFNSLADQNTTIEMDENAQQKVAQFTKKFTKTLSIMRDIYGNITAPEAMMKLKTITGLADQGEQSKALTGLISVSKANGIDPRSVISDLTNPVAIAAGVERLRGGWGESGGQPVNTGSPDEQTTQIAQSVRAAAQRRAMLTHGVSPGEDAKNFDKDKATQDYARTLEQSSTLVDKAWSNNFRTALGAATVEGNEEAKKEFMDITKRFGNASTDTERQRAQRDLINAGNKYGIDIATLSTTEHGRKMAAQVDAEGQEALLDLGRGSLIEAGTASVSRKGTRLANKLGSTGAAKAASHAIADKLGESGLAALMQEKDPAAFLGANFSGEELKLAQQALLGADGTLDVGMVKHLKSNFGLERDKLGGSVYATKQGEANLLNNWQPDAGNRFGDGKGSMLQKIVSYAMSKDGDKLFTDDELRTQALLEAGAITGETQGAAHIADYKNLSDADLKKMQEAGGKDFDIAKATGYKDIGELQAAIKDPKKRMEFFAALEEKGIKMSRDSSGDGFTAVNTDVLRSDAANKTLENMRTAGAWSKFIGQEADENNPSTKALLEGKGLGEGVVKEIMEASYGRLRNENGTEVGLTPGKDWYKDETLKVTNWKESKERAGLVGSMSDNEIAGLKNIDEQSGGKISYYMKEQRNSYRRTLDAMEKGEVKELKDNDGNKITKEAISEMIKQLDTSLAKLGEQKEQVIESMRVTKLEVTGSMNQQ